jgi:hypothetical protein
MPLRLLSGTRKNSQAEALLKLCIFLAFNRRLAWPNFSHNAGPGAVTSGRAGNSFFVGPFTQTQTQDTFHQGSVKMSRPGMDGAWLVPRGRATLPSPFLQPVNHSCNGAVGLKSSRCGLSIAVNLGTPAGRRTFIGRIRKGTSPGIVIERAFVPVVLRSSIGGRRSSLHDFQAERVNPWIKAWPTRTVCLYLCSSNQI